MLPKFDICAKENTPAHIGGIPNDVMGMAMTPSVGETPLNTSRGFI